MTNKKPSTTDILYQDIHHLQGALTDANAQIARIQRVMKLDDLENQAFIQDRWNNLVGIIENNTEATTALVRKLEPQDGILADDFYRMEKRTKQAQRQKNLRYARKLEVCKKKITPECPCGEHKGIRFLDVDGNTIEERCPKSWWITLSRLAFEDGKLDQFVSSTPLTKYIKAYNKRK